MRSLAPLPLSLDRLYDCFGKQDTGEMRLHDIRPQGQIEATLQHVLWNLGMLAWEGVRVESH